MDAPRTASTLIVDLASEDETVRLGRAVAELVVPGVVIGLVGPLGAGKTYLARAIAESLGVDPGAIASPTFVLIHEYQGRLPVYHFLLPGDCWIITLVPTGPTTRSARIELPSRWAEAVDHLMAFHA
jgi:hypothetical protein